ESAKIENSLLRSSNNVSFFNQITTKKNSISISISWLD
ncbi:MAG: hypothetical protein ACI9Z7_001085, partial [Alteromonas macleodii]